MKPSRADAGWAFFPCRGSTTPQEAAALGKSFVAWAKTAAPAVPVQTVLSTPIDPQGPVEVVGKCGLLSGTSASLSNDNRQAMAFGSQWGDCERRRKTAPLPADEQRCSALEAAGNLSGFLRQMSCGRPSSLPGMTFSDPLTIAIRFSSSLPAPEVELGTQRKMAAEIALRITRVNFSAQPPRATDVLPPDAKNLLRIAGNRPAQRRVCDLRCRFDRRSLHRKQP